MHACMHACMYVCVYIYIYIYIYVREYCSLGVGRLSYGFWWVSCFLTRSSIISP